MLSEIILRAVGGQVILQPNVDDKIYKSKIYGKTLIFSLYLAAHTFSECKSRTPAGDF